MILYWVSFNETCPHQTLYFGSHTIKFISLLEASKYKMADLCILNFSIRNNTDGGNKDYWIETNYINALSKHIQNLTDSVQFSKNPDKYPNWSGTPPSLMSLWNTLCIKPKNGGLYLHIGAYNSYTEYKTNNISYKTIQWLIDNRQYIEQLKQNRDVLIFHGNNSNDIVDMWKSLHIDNMPLQPSLINNTIIKCYMVHRGKYSIQNENILINP